MPFVPVSLFHFYQILHKDVVTRTPLKQISPYRLLSSALADEAHPEG